MPPGYPDRLARASEAAGDAGLGALLVTPSADLVYLTGYSPPALPRLTCLVIRPGKEPVLLVPELERALAEGMGLGKTTQIASWGETEDPYSIVSGMVGDAEHAGCSDRMWAAHLLRLQAAFNGTRF